MRSSCRQRGALERRLTSRSLLAKCVETPTQISHPVPSHPCKVRSECVCGYEWSVRVAQVHGDIDLLFDEAAMVSKPPVHPQNSVALASTTPTPPAPLSLNTHPRAPITVAGQRAVPGSDGIAGGRS